jgi:hypothetical protein
MSIWSSAEVVWLRRLGGLVLQPRGQVVSVKHGLLVRFPDFALQGADTIAHLVQETVQLYFHVSERFNNILVGVLSGLIGVGARLSYDLVCSSLGGLHDRVSLYELIALFTRDCQRAVGFFLGLGHNAITLGL